MDKRISTLDSCPSKVLSLCTSLEFSRTPSLLSPQPNVQSIPIKYLQQSPTRLSSQKTRRRRFQRQWHTIEPQTIALVTLIAKNAETVPGSAAVYSLSRSGRCRPGSRNFIVRQKLVMAVAVTHRTILTSWSSQKLCSFMGRWELC